MTPDRGETSDSGADYDWDELHARQLEGMLGLARAQGYQGPLPDDVEFIRFLSESEVPRVHAECMTAHGFVSDYDWQGHWPVDDVPADQQQAYWGAWLRCWIQYPQHPRYTVPLNEDQIQVYYEYYRDELIPCLTEAGFETGELPSWENFLATYHTKSQWDPYAADVVQRNLSAQEWDEINRRCPQNPPEERLWGDLVDG